jgi:hypothetical protein
MWVVIAFGTVPLGVGVLQGWVETTWLRRHVGAGVKTPDGDVFVTVRRPREDGRLDSVAPEAFLIGPRSRTKHRGGASGALLQGSPGGGPTTRLRAMRRVGDGHRHNAFAHLENTSARSSSTQSVG